MSIEQEVVRLTEATTELLDVVTERKKQLEEAVVNASGSAEDAEASAVLAASHATASGNSATTSAAEAVKATTQADRAKTEADRASLISGLDTVDEAIKQSPFILDYERRALEAATGGTCTILYTTKGQPTYMHVIPRFNLQDIDPALGTGTHPAFIVNGVEKSELFIGQHLGCLRDGELLSLPGVEPLHSVTFDEALTYGAACGQGFHAMTHAEQSAIAHWCKKNGFMPRGNTGYGRAHDAPFETARRVDGGAPGVTSGNPRTLTGSGPVSWRHNNNPNGIADLCGNVWEWRGGLRLVDGEIQVLANNNAADSKNSQAKTSTHWRAISAATGELVAPGSAGTLKYDASAAGTTTDHGAPVLSDAVSNRNGEAGSDEHTPGNTGEAFEKITSKAGLVVPSLAKALSLFPLDASHGGDELYVRNYGERLALSGGNWGNGAAAGVFALYLNYARSAQDTSIGARPAFVL